MEFLFNQPNAKAILALRFGEDSKRLFKTTQTLCKKFGMNLRLIHVVEEVTPIGYNYQGYPGTYGTVQWLRGAEEEAVADVERHMKGMMDSKDSLVRVETQAILSPDICSALLAESRNAPLLVVGAGEHQYNMIPKGLSVVLSVLSEAQIPVLVIRSAIDFDFGQGYRMLIADDLEAGSIKVITTAMDFAIASGATELMHAHFLHPHAQKFANYPRSESKGEAPPPEDFLSEMEKGIERVLKSRSRASEQRLESAGCRYRTFVTTGRVSEGLKSLIKDYKPDVVVFGRPQPTKLKPSYVGRAAVNSLWTGTHAALVVPWK